MARIKGSQMGAFFLLAFALLTTGAHSNPWFFQEIKPLTEADDVKKSNIPDVPVKDADPATPTIHIKQDIRDDIIGKNTSSTKFKEGVKKLLDFLEAGPKVADDDADKTGNSPSPPNSQNPKGNETLDAAKDNKKIVKQNNESLSYKQDKQSEFIGINSKDLNTDNRLGSLEKDNSKPLKESNSNFLDQQKEPPAIPMRSEIHGNGDPMHVTASLLNDVTVDKNLHSVANGDHLSPFDKESHYDKSLKESNSNFVTQQKEPPAIPMRSQINSNGMLATASLLHSGIMAKESHVLGTTGSNMVGKSQIPYTTIPYGATQLVQNNAFTRSKILSPRMHFNPYSALYQRSSLPQYFGNYGVARRPLAMATQPYRYPYNQRQMLPLKPNTFNPALRSNIRLPIYQSATVRSPAYNPNPRPRLPYTKTIVPGRPAMVPQRTPMALFAAKRSNIPNFRNFQVPHHVNPLLPNWNLLGRSALFRPQLSSKGMKYRRMAINDRGRSYNGLSSTRDKVSQKTPLPLPLASIMTAARIVVPARPHTLNGVFKSSVETFPSADPVEKGVRAV